MILSIINFFLFIQVLEKNIEKFAQAYFYGPVAGTVLFRWLGSQTGNDTDTIIHTNLHHIHKQKLQSLNYTEHYWKIYVTDILETGKGIRNCKISYLILILIILTINRIIFL